MEIKLLKKGYKNNQQFYEDFLEDKIKDKDEYFSDETVNLDKIPDFPIYMAKGSEKQKEEEFLEAFKVISEAYININREITLDETFWHSLLCVYKRDYLLKKYPQIKESQGNFNNVVIKSFNWENYVYKSILAVQYIKDNVESDTERLRYFKLVIENLDFYNYIIKAEIFRNDIFLINMLDIIDAFDLGEILKSKIKDRPDLGEDERYGRRVIFEFNKSYPIVMSPMLGKEELTDTFFQYLSYYYNIDEIEKYNQNKNLAYNE